MAGAPGGVDLYKAKLEGTSIAGLKKQILDIELRRVQERILSSAGSKQFVFRCTPSARDFLLREGTDTRYGARHLKRSIERHLVFPLANLIATGQISLGD